MSRTIQRRPRVGIDLIEQADYIARNNLQAALRYLDAAEATFRDLAAQPALGSPCFFDSPRAADLRRWRVRGFENYVIFYREIEDGVEIARVLHGARDIEAIFGPDEP